MGGRVNGAANVAQRVGTVHQLSAMSLTAALPPEPVRLVSLHGHVAAMTVIQQITDAAGVPLLQSFTFF